MPEKIAALAEKLIDLQERKDDLSPMERTALQTLSNTPEVVELAEKTKGQTAGGQGATLPPSVVRAMGDAPKTAFPATNGVATSTIPKTNPMVPQTPAQPTGRPTLSQGARNRGVRPSIQDDATIKLAQEPEVDEKTGKVKNWLALAAPLLGLGIGAWGGKKSAAIGFAGGAGFGESYFTTKRQRALDEEARLERKLKREREQKADIKTEIERLLSVGDFQGAMDEAVATGDASIQDRTTTTINALIEKEDDDERDAYLDLMISMSAQAKSPEATKALAVEISERYPDDQKASQLAAFLNSSAADMDSPENERLRGAFSRYETAIGNATTVGQLDALRATINVTFDPDNPDEDRYYAALDKALDGRTTALKATEDRATLDKAIDRTSKLVQTGLYSEAAKHWSAATGTTVTANDFRRRPGTMSSQIADLARRLIDDGMSREDAETAAIDIITAAWEAEERRFGEADTTKKDKTGEASTEEEIFPGTGITKGKVQKEEARAKWIKEHNIPPRVLELTDDDDVALALSNAMKDDDYTPRRSWQWGFPPSRREPTDKKTAADALKRDLAIAEGLTAEQKREVFRLWEWAYEDFIHRNNVEPSFVSPSGDYTPARPWRDEGQFGDLKYPRKPKETYEAWKERTRPKRATPAPKTEPETVETVPTAPDSSRAARNPGTKAYSF